MGNEIRVFSSEEFGNVRGVEINGEPWLVGKDVAEALGYSNSRKAIIDHVDEEDKTILKVQTEYGMQNMVVINIEGLYALIVRSKCPKAKQLRPWAKASILPILQEKANKEYLRTHKQETMPDEELIAKALVIANRILENRKL